MHGIPVNSEKAGAGSKTTKKWPTQATVSEIHPATKEIAASYDILIISPRYVECVVLMSRVK
jgi:hypothetical protein